MKLFGTDGIRGLVNEELNVELALKVGASVAHVLKKEYKKNKLNFFIGSDTRISKDMLKNAVISGFLSEGSNIVDLGIIPTPAISYLITKYNYDGGIVISASHNPTVYNGIKVFNSLGYKLDDKLEDKIENYLLTEFNYNNKLNEVGVSSYKDLKEEYASYLVSTINNKKIPFKVLIDVANGASYETADMIFKKLDIDYKIINNKVDGYNINDNAGSTHMEGLREKVLKEKYDLGIAFDGDADRCLFIDSHGEEVDGDFVLAICAKYMNLDKVVGTVMTNLGLIKYLESENKKFVATGVGDKYVLLEMLKNEELVGGEQSGHIIFRKYLNTGCGELTALQILNIMTKENKSLYELKQVMKKYPQVLINLEVEKKVKDSFDDNKDIQKIIKEYEKKLDEGRILVRKSGTENLIRIMFEGENIEYITKLANELKSKIEELIN